MERTVNRKKKTWWGGWIIMRKFVSAIICLPRRSGAIHRGVICVKRKTWLWGWEYLIFYFSAFSAFSAVRRTEVRIRNCEIIYPPKLYL